MKRIAVLTSGGDAPGMNPAIRAIVKLGTSLGAEVLAVEQGYEGLLQGRLRPLLAAGVDEDLLQPQDIDRIVRFGGTILGSSRSQQFRTPEGRAKAAQQLKGVDGLIVIGGNGSLTGAHLLAKEHPHLNVVGVPASIDNDIGATSMAIGVDTALNTIVQACDRVLDTARAHRRAFIVEVMGRDCGYLAMASAVAVGADGALFREQRRSDDEVIASVEDLIRRGFSLKRNKKRVLLIKSEGIKVGTAEMVDEIQKRLKSELADVEVRGTVLGHVVRGGSPSFFDRMLAGRLAYAALLVLKAGGSDCMVAWQPYEKLTIDAGRPTTDTAIQVFPLADVLSETDALLDGSSPVTQWRVKMMEEVEGVLGL